MTKLEERIEARRLRREEGLALKVIARQLGVAVSSVSRWVRDIELTEAQIAVLAAGNPIYNQQRRGRGGRAERARADRLAAQAHGRELAKGDDALHRQGCMLHWAEGSRARNTVTFTNSDGDMVVLFVRFLRECYGVRDDQFTLTVNCFLNNGLTLQDVEGWWLDRLQLPASSLRAAAVNRPSSASRFRGNTLPFGTARVCVHSTFIVQSIYGAIQEYAGIERPEWLD
jgi:hypothetical protein